MDEKTVECLTRENINTYCSCPKTDCPRHGLCCECILAHKTRIDDPIMKRFPHYLFRLSEGSVRPSICRRITARALCLFELRVAPTNLRTSKRLPPERAMLRGTQGLSFVHCSLTRSLPPRNKFLKLDGFVKSPFAALRYYSVLVIKIVDNAQFLFDKFGSGIALQESSRRRALLWSFAKGEAT